ncbi:hypothetical protein IF2G_04313 [Cordyceps javanica]|nr:hypothetical protein IF2G_04313 [Cordyceps javanica]
MLTGQCCSRNLMNLALDENFERLQRRLSGDGRKSKGTDLGKSLAQEGEREAGQLWPGLSTTKRRGSSSRTRMRRMGCQRGI